jgi:hypothetical protein
MEVKCAVIHWVFRKGYSVLLMVVICCVTIEAAVQRFYFQVPTDVIVSLRSGIREALDLLVVYAVEFSGWKCPHCLSSTMHLAHIAV